MVTAFSPSGDRLMPKGSFVIRTTLPAGRTQRPLGKTVVPFKFICAYWSRPGTSKIFFSFTWAKTEIFATLPNPIIDKLALSSEITNQFDGLRLFDTTGKLLLEKTILSNEIDLSFLNSGLYFIQFNNIQQQAVCIKIMKK